MKEFKKKKNQETIEKEKYLPADCMKNKVVKNGRKLAEFLPQAPNADGGEGFCRAVAAPLFSPLNVHRVLKRMKCT